MPEKPLRRVWKISSMVLLAAVVLAPLVALMVAGTSSRATFLGSESFEHGWPYTFLKRSVSRADTSRWALWNGSREWNQTGAAADLGFFAAAIAVVAAISIWRVRRNRVWCLTLRECLTLMLLFALFAAHCGWCVRRGERAAAIGNQLGELGAGVDYQYGGPKWLLRLEGQPRGRLYEYFKLDSIHEVSLSDIGRKDFAKACKLLREVESVQHVSLNRVDEAKLQLGLESMTICQPEIVYLMGLDLKSPKDKSSSGNRLEPLTRNPRLRCLNLAFARIDDADAAVLIKCRRLQYIDLQNTEVTNAGVQKLLALPELKRISISPTAESDELVKQADAAGVKLYIERIRAQRTMNSGFGGGPPNSAKPIEE